MRSAEKKPSVPAVAEAVAAREPADGIYLDNAATSFPKPPLVLQAILDYHKNLGASAGRGSYPRAVLTGRLLEDTRKLLARLFHIADPNHVILTHNATDSLNLAIKGIDWHTGDSAVVTAIEHNSVSRPLNQLKARRGIKINKVRANSEGWVDPADFARAIEPQTKLIVTIHASNVTGTLQPIAEIGEIARRKGIPYLVDAAQSAGAVPIDVEAMKIDLLAFPGHKALLGPLGTGGLFVRSGLELETLCEGGTGSQSEQEVQPDFLPDKFEAGSHNALGIAGWKAALEFILSETVPKIRRHEENLTRQFLEGASKIKSLTVYGPRKAEGRAAVLPVRLGDFAPMEFSHRLFERAGLMTRSGLHCAPGAHQTIGTFPDGATRFSFGYFNTPAHVECSLRALTELSIR